MVPPQILKQGSVSSLDRVQQTYAFFMNLEWRVSIECSKDSQRWLDLKKVGSGVRLERVEKADEKWSAERVRGPRRTSEVPVTPFWSKFWRLSFLIYLYIYSRIYFHLLLFSKFSLSTATNQGSTSTRLRRPGIFEFPAREHEERLIKSCFMSSPSVERVFK